MNEKANGRGTGTDTANGAGAMTDRAKRGSQ